MTLLQRRLAAAALLLAPLLLTASELARLRVDGAYVEDESDPVADAGSHISAVGQSLDLWRTAGLLALGFTVAWGLSLLAGASVISEHRPVLGAVAGVLAVVAVTGSALHLAFYYLPLADLAGSASSSEAARAGALLDGGDAISAVAFLVFLLGLLAAPAVAAFGLWRVRVLPWWAALAMLAWIVGGLVGAEGEPAAFVNLLLLIPAAVLARYLLRRPAPLSTSQPVATWS
jgi:hypothetical protein